MSHPYAQPLSDLATRYAKAPVMSAAIKRAIDAHGPDAPAVIIGGQPSFRPNSNTGCVMPRAIYPGPRRRRCSEGHYNVVIL